jgi:hypothetical protein
VVVQQLPVDLLWESDVRKLDISVSDSIRLTESHRLDELDGDVLHLNLFEGRVVLDQLLIEVTRVHELHVHHELIPCLEHAIQNHNRQLQLRDLHLIVPTGACSTIWSRGAIGAIAVADERVQDV